MRKFVISLILLFSVYSSAVIALTADNMGFENQLSGWDSFGNVTITDSVSTQYNGVLTASEGDYFAAISTNSFYPTTDYGGTTGSIIETDINLSAGDTFSFDWAFSTNDYQPYNDFSLFVSDTEILLADVNQVGNYGSSDWTTFEWLATDNYAGNISFVVSNALDPLVASSLFIDNLQIESTNVPEPGMPFLIAAGMIILYFSKKEIKPPTFG